MHRPAYAKDIDGLRAISVLAVILFHYAPGIGNAGHLGVDIFFVISGFVITASIANYPPVTSLRQFSSLFYMRRIRRLFPALLAMVLVTCVLAVLLVSQAKPGLRTGALSLIGGANIFLYAETQDYFGLASELNPFTHMWSLSVEDQFYAIFPLLIWYFGFSRDRSWHPQRLFAPFLILSALTLAAFLIAYQWDYSFGFYMMPTRFWQIGAGIIAYVLVCAPRPAKSRIGALSKLPLALPVAAILAVLMLGHRMPATAHVLVVLATVPALMIIWQRKERGSWLGSPVMAYLGKLSYSLYLWHWPLLVLAKHTFGSSPTISVVCLVISLLLAAASYHLLETRFLISPTQRPANKAEADFRWASGAIVLASVVLLGFASLATRHENSVLARFYGIPEIPPNDRHPCDGALLKRLEKPMATCLGSARTETTPRKLFFLGDSHGNQLTGMFSRVLADTDYALQFANFNFDERGVNGLIRNRDYIPQEFRYVLTEARPGDIFALTFHRGRLSRERDKHLSAREAGTTNPRMRNLVSNLTGFLHELDAKGVSIVLILDTPLMAAAATPQTCAMQIRFSGSSVCEVTETQDRLTRRRQEWVYQALQEKLPAIQIWDPFDILYQDRDTFDVIDGGDNYLMSDNNHITDFTTRMLQKDFGALFEKVRQLR